nr:hypothetical protein [Pandoravirus massiliensis]
MPRMETTPPTTSSSSTTPNVSAIASRTARPAPHSQANNGSSSSNKAKDNGNNMNSNNNRSNKKGPKPLTGDPSDDRGAVDLFGAWYLDDGARLYGLKPKPGDVERVWQYMLPPRAPSPMAKWCRAYWMRQEAANTAARWGDAEDAAAQNVRKTIDGRYASLDDVVRQITRTVKDARGHQILVMATHALEEAGWRFVLRRTQSNARERVVPIDSVDALVDALAVVLSEEPEIDAVRRYPGSAAHGSLVGWDAMIEARKRRHSTTASVGTTSPALPFSCVLPHPPPAPLPQPCCASTTAPWPIGQSRAPTPAILAYPARALLPAAQRRARDQEPASCDGPLLHAARDTDTRAEAPTLGPMRGDVAKTRGHAHDPLLVGDAEAGTTFDIDLNNPPDDTDDAAWAAVVTARNSRKRHLDPVPCNAGAVPVDDRPPTKQARSTLPHVTRKRYEDCRPGLDTCLDDPLLPGALDKFADSPFAMGDAGRPEPHTSAAEAIKSHAMPLPSSPPIDRGMACVGGNTGSTAQPEHHTRASHHMLHNGQDPCGDDATLDDGDDNTGTANRAGGDDEDDETDDEEEDALRRRAGSRADVTACPTVSTKDDDNHQGSPGDETSQSGDDNDEPITSRRKSGSRGATAAFGTGFHPTTAVIASKGRINADATSNRHSIASTASHCPSRAHRQTATRPDVEKVNFF